MYKLLNSDL